MEASTVVEGEERKGPFQEGGSTCALAHCICSLFLLLNRICVHNE
jgi:hypothetical protein